MESIEKPYQYLPKDYADEGGQYQTETRPTRKEQRDFNASYELLLKCRKQNYGMLEARRDAHSRVSINWKYNQRAKAKKI